jgi:hypothetical protein
MMLEHVHEEQPFRILGCGISFSGNEGAILLNQSTTTMITSNSIDGGKLIMKSMDTLSHGHLGIDNSRNRHVCFLLSVQLC